MTSSPTQTTTFRTTRRAFLMSAGALAFAAPFAWHVSSASASRAARREDFPGYDPIPSSSHQRIFAPTDDERVGLIQAFVINFGSNLDAEDAAPVILQRFKSFAESEDDQNWDELSEVEADDLPDTTYVWSGVAFSASDDAEIASAALAISTNESYSVLVSVLDSDLRERQATALAIELIDRMSSAPHGDYLPPCGSASTDGTRNDEEWSLLPTVDDLPERDWEFVEEGTIPWLLDETDEDDEDARADGITARPIIPLSCVQPDED